MVMHIPVVIEKKVHTPEPMAEIRISVEENFCANAITRRLTWQFY
jgi:hypothetical protein